MTKMPSFYCCRTLLGFAPEQDLNRVTLYGPDDFQFVLYEMAEKRPANAHDRCNLLAQQLRVLWDNKKAAPEGGLIAAVGEWRDARKAILAYDMKPNPSAEQLALWGRLAEAESRLMKLASGEGIEPSSTGLEAAALPLS